MGEKEGHPWGKEAVGMEEENNKDRKVILSFKHYMVPNSNFPFKNPPRN